MRKALIISVLLLLFNVIAATAAPLDSLMLSDQPKAAVVVFLDSVILQNQKSLGIIKDGLRDKFGKTDIMYYGDDQAKSPAFLEFMEKVLTDPVNDRKKGIVLIKNEYLRKLGKDTNSQYVVLVNLNRTYPSTQFIWSKLTYTVIEVETGKPVAMYAWHKGKTDRPTEVAEHYMTSIRDDLKWPISFNAEEINTGALQDNALKPAVVLFLPHEILAEPEQVQKIKNAIIRKFKVDNVPIYIDNKPKSQAFVKLAFLADVDSSKQGMTIVRKEYLTDYGKQTNSHPVIAIKISVTDFSFAFWDMRPDPKLIFRLKEEILVVDTEKNQYIASTTFDTAKNKNLKDGVDFLIDKLEKEFVLP